MKAGRELDVLILEKVFKRSPIYEHGEVGEDSCGRPVCHDCGEVGHWQDGNMFGALCCRFYSTSIAEAWRVVKKMEAEGYQWELHAQGPVRSDMSKRPYAQFSHYDNGSLEIFAFAEGDTITHAICLAALKAVGVELKGDA